MVGSDTSLIFTPTWENDPFWQTYFEVKGLKPPASLVEVKRCLRKEALGSKSTMLPWGIWSDCSGALGEWRLHGFSRWHKVIGRLELPKLTSKWYTTGSNSYETNVLNVCQDGTPLSSSDIGWLGHEGSDVNEILPILKTFNLDFLHLLWWYVP